MFDLVGDLLRVADRLHADRFHVVGHDWGGAVGWVTAAIQPHRVASLTALSTPHPDALFVTVGDADHPQAAASAYMHDFRSTGSEHLFLTHGRSTFEGFFGPDAGGLPQTKVVAYADVLATPDALCAALNWYRANVPPEALLKIRVLLTVLGGQDTYRARDF